MPFATNLFICQCSNFDKHLDMSSVYKDGQNEAFREAVSK